MRTALPAEPNDFVGRERDVTELGVLLDAARLVTLCGPGGIGKTRLALRVAHAATADEVWFVELADMLPGGEREQLVQRIARTLGLAQEEGDDLADTLVHVLRARKILLVLDTCEHVVDACAELARRLLGDCPSLRILTTSREPLRIPGESVWRVPPLELPGPGDPDVLETEAVRLFAVRAGAVRPGFRVGDDAESVARVCRALDGVPLALELAAARVRVLSVEQLADRLVDRFGLLSAGDRTAPNRQRTLRSTIDWSHDLLTEPEQLLLRRLSVFASWTVDQAEQICADDLLPAMAVLDALMALVDKSLVVVVGEVAGEVRFRLLDSIRQYAAERLEAAGESAGLRDRHRDWYVRAAERDFLIAWARIPKPWAHLVRMNGVYIAEQDNVRAALAWSLERGDIEQGLRIWPAMHVFSVCSGHFSEWAGWTDRFLARAADAPGEVAGAALVTRGQLAMEFHEPGVDLEAHFTAALAALAGGDDAAMRATAHYNRAIIRMTAGRMADASADLTAAEDYAEANGDTWTEALTCYVRAVMLFLEGRSREATERGERGVRLMRGLDQQWGVARGLVTLGRLAQGRGDYAAASAHFAEALPALREFGARPEIVRCLAGLGRAALGRGDRAGARTALEESLRLARGLGMRRAVARCLESLAELRGLEGDQRSVVLLSGAAAALREELGGAAVPGARLETLLDPVRRIHGHPLVAHWWAEGRALDVEDAVALALAMPSEAPEQTIRPIEPITPPSTLTQREREISLLIARGLSNKGIAGELVISPATVARHVTNILTKLGFTSRAQVAAWAVDHAQGEP